MSDPLAIFDVRLTSQGVFDVLCICKDYIKVVLEKIEDRFPVYALLSVATAVTPYSFIHSLSFRRSLVIIGNVLISNFGDLPSGPWAMHAMIIDLWTSSPQQLFRIGCMFTSFEIERGNLRYCKYGTRALLKGQHGY